MTTQAETLTSSATVSIPGLYPTLPCRFKKERDKKANGLLALAPDISSGLNSSHSNQHLPPAKKKRSGVKKKKKSDL